MLYKCKPHLTKVQKFGQKCFVLKNQSELSGKLDAKSKKGIFLGFEAGTKDA